MTVTTSFLLDLIHDRFPDWQLASEYGEPGYSGGPVVLGSYWCRCHRFGTDDPITTVGPNGTERTVTRGTLHAVEQHWPRIFAQLESDGVELEWCDEWTIDYETDKAYRTEPDSYGWQPSVVFTEYGDMLTPDSDIEELIAWVTDDPINRAVPRTLATGADLVAAGFTLHSSNHETGWHPHQTDNPREIVGAILDRFEDTQVCCTVDSVGQFDARWSVYVRPIVHELGA